MGYTDEEMVAMLVDTCGIHHLSKAEFTTVIKKKPYDAVNDKKIVFLDLKYWISFRMIIGDENISRTMSSEQITLFKQVYEKLKQLTANGKIACVLSDSILTEVEKMPLERRLETAKIMDSLQTKVVLNGLNACSVETVNIDLIASKKPPIEDYHLSSVFEANRFLAAVYLNELKDEPDVLYNIMYDSMSRMTVTEYLTETDGERFDSSEKFAEMFNNTKLKDTTINTYEQLLIDGLKSQAKSLRKIIDYNPITDIKPEDHLISYQRNAPFLYLHSAIHAALSLEKARKIYSNDFYDLSHSCMGVGYADYFFTEKKFHHLLKSNPINCSALYKCSIHSNLSEIVNTLEQL